MAEANDAQMQQFANERLRPRAEQLRALFNSVTDDQAAIDEVYDRSDNGALWEDNRTDGPPRLLKAGTGANPNDMLNYNSALARINQFRNGTFANVGEANEFAALWAVLQDACVHPV